MLAALGRLKRGEEVLGAVILVVIGLAIVAMMQSGCALGKGNGDSP
jgi:hypothetical protein